MLNQFTSYYHHHDRIENQIYKGLLTPFTSVHITFHPFLSSSFPYLQKQLALQTNLLLTNQSHTRGQI